MMPVPAISTARKVGLGVEAVVAGAVGLLELYFGALLTYGWFWPLPPAWPGVLISLVAGLAGPSAAYLARRAGRRSGKPSAETLKKMVIIGGSIGFLGLLVLSAMLVVAAPF